MTTTTLPTLPERLALAAKAHPFHKFVQSIYGQCCIQGRTISQKQYDAIVTVLDNFDRDAIQLSTTPPLIPGKQLFEGIVQSIKEVDSKFGTRLKMVVRLSNGNKVYSTVPNKLIPTKGQSVKFSGELTVSESDPHFGFVKFPSI
jgi:cobalamin biosynthesis Co2+ chelatase CbiK